MENLDNAPLVQKEEIEQIVYGPIVVDAASNTFVGSTIDVCNVNDFKTFAEVKTLNDADESSLEIRADNQTQTEQQFIAEGNAEAERVNEKCLWSCRGNFY